MYGSARLRMFAKLWLRVLVPGMFGFPDTTAIAERGTFGHPAIGQHRRGTAWPGSRDIGLTGRAGTFGSPDTGGEGAKSIGPTPGCLVWGRRF